MKKILVSFGCLLALFLIFGIFAFVSGLEENYSSLTSEEAISELINSSESALSPGVSEYVKDFVAKKGISPHKISNVSQVSFEDLPKEVNIENVNDNNLAIYEVDYNETEESQKKIFVITYSVDKLKAQGDLIISHDKRMFLNFGISSEISSSEFLKTASGVEGSLEKGYVMMRKGSITGISTALESVEANEENRVEIIIYKNGQPIGFGNTINLNSVGIKKDYDVQSKNVVTFEPGDVLSAYAKTEGTVKGIITLVEITTAD